MTPSLVATVASFKQRWPARPFWLKQLHRWHWISAALSLVGILLFAVTGVTLNHAAQIESQAQVTRLQAVLPVPLRERLRASAQNKGALPTEVDQWLAAQWSASAGAGRAVPEWSDDELYLSMPRPGGDAWISIDLQTGAAVYERTDRGWVSYLNDLHKGRNAGAVWSGFIDAFAAACLIFSLTGLFLLQLHAPRRPATWPVTGLGLLLPLLIAILFVH